MNKPAYILFHIKRYFVNLGAALAGRVTKEQIQVGKALAEIYDLYLAEAAKNIKPASPVKKATAKKSPAKPVAKKATTKKKASGK